MKIYRVGGYVRDKLLGIPASDCDYVVIGSTPAAMKTLGYIQVGKSFPVFLHPKTKEEYALARKEKKTGNSHTAFAVDFGPEISLEEDLFRRDLTINAIAEDMDNSELIDPFGGIKDLNKNIIRHVSVAFSEDPLRILRVARFVAKLNFKVAPETMALMQKMSRLDDIKTISRERIMNELESALNCQYSSKFFITLAECHCLHIFFPTLAKLNQINDWQKFLHQFDSATTKINKYILLGMLYLEHGYVANLKELSLNKSIISDIQHIALLSSLEIDNSSEKILATFKKLNLWRNQTGFNELLEKFNHFLLSTEQQTAKITLIQNLAIKLLNLNIMSLVETFSGPQLIVEIHQLQITEIEKFKGALT